MGRKTWTIEEINTLKENFPNGGIYKCVELLPNRTRKQIKAKIDALGIKSNHYTKWSPEENEKLKFAWENYTMEELLKTFPGRTYQQIELHAHWLGYHTETERKRKCDISFLNLENLTKESLYWWGFIMADGHISESGEVIIQLKDTDKNHLEKFSKHVKGNIKEVKKGFVRISCGDIKKVRVWREKLNMKETAKTYFPPNLSVFEKDFIYFFIGFVDGDGCIWLSKGYPQLKIELHCTWKDNLDWFANILKSIYDIKSVTTKISKKGTAVLTIGNRNDIIKISEYCNDIEYLERKWEKVLGV